MRRLVSYVMLIACALSIVSCSQTEDQTKNQAVLRTNTVALEKVRFGMLPYGDHTYAIIGVKKGWFKDVGIDLEYQTVKIEDVIPYLKNGTLDAASLPPGILFSAYRNAPEMISFVFNDIFQGYTIMAQPAKGYKSCQEFAKQGMSPAQSIKAVVEQMKGKTFAYPAETAIKPFIDLTLKKGGLQQSDFKALVLDDPLTINAMRNKQADFQVGGAPSRVILQREGFVPLLNANDIAHAASPSPDSAELASILEDSWVTTKDYYKKHHDTVLRLAAVNFRILRFMNEHADQALALHMPYLSQVTGQPFSLADGKIIYKQLDPFITFEKQSEWFHNPKCLYYYVNVNGSILNNFIHQGIYKAITPKVEDVIWCQHIYKEMETLKGQAKKLIDRVPPQLESVADCKQKLQQAKEFYDNYDYLDALRIAKELAPAAVNSK